MIANPLADLVSRWLPPKPPEWKLVVDPCVPATQMMLMEVTGAAILAGWTTLAECDAHPHLKLILVPHEGAAEDVRRWAAEAGLEFID